MKHLFLFISMIVLSLSLTARADEAPGVSLLSNSDFKTDDGTGKPAGWPIKDGITWEQEGDLRFLRFTSPEAGKMVMAYRQIPVPASRPEALEVHVRARANDVKPGAKAWNDARVMIQWKDAKGKVLKQMPPAPAFKGTTNGWVDKRVYFAIPAKAAVLEIMPCLFNAASGTLDIATLEVLPSTADKLPAPPPMVPSEPIAVATPVPTQLKVVGNELRTLDGKSVWLQGLCLDSMQWNAVGEKILISLPVAIEQWHANVIRLPVVEEFWFGWGKWQGKDREGKNYRKIVDDAIAAANSRGAYLVIDLHRFGAPTPKHVAFWKDVAIRYKDHPGVVFELFNEPHDISWKVWRDGGNIKEGDNDDVGVKENNEAMDEDNTPGIQALVDVIRQQGAKNLIIAGGLNWSYNLQGILKGFDLKDHDGGYGIMYSTHVYPWKKDWQKNFIDVAAKYPIFVGEVGCPEKWEDFKFIPEGERYEELGPSCTWPNDMLATIQKYKLNWTGFSFHPKCGPMVISDWDYTPTAYWGVYVKRALAGEQFTAQKLR